VDRLVIPERDVRNPQPGNFLSLNAFDGDHENSDVFHKEEMTTVVPDVGVNSRNGIYEVCRRTINKR
jgi:hypothetical protein